MALAALPGGTETPPELAPRPALRPASACSGPLARSLLQQRGGRPAALRVRGAQTPGRLQVGAGVDPPATRDLGLSVFSVVHSPPPHSAGVCRERAASRRASWTEGGHSTSPLPDGSTQSGDRVLGSRELGAGGVQSEASPRLGSSEHRGTDWGGEAGPPAGRSLCPCSRRTCEGQRPPPVQAAGYPCRRDVAALKASCHSLCPRSERQPWGCRGRVGRPRAGLGTVVQTQTAHFTRRRGIMA